MPEPVSANFPKFTSDELFRFIIEYSKHPELYEFDHPLYTNYMERNKHFELMAENLQIEGLTPERVRAKIKVFRGNYTHRLKDFYRKQQTGEPFSAPRWWHLADQFLRPFIRFHDPDISNNLAWNHSLNSTAREAEIFFGSESQDGGTVEITESVGYDEQEAAVQAVEEEDEEEEEPATVVETFPTEEESIYVELDDDQLMAIESGEMTLEEVTAQVQAAAAAAQEKNPDRRRKLAKAPEPEVKPPKTKKKKVTPEVDSDQEPEDEFDAFGRCIALQLKTLPLDTALLLESEIHALIRKKRMTTLKSRFKR